jgi:hypothetical protein
MRAAADVPRGAPMQIPAAACRVRRCASRFGPGLTEIGKRARFAGVSQIFR